MRVGVVYERKADYPFLTGDSADANSELLSAGEEHELLMGLRDAGHDVIPIGDAQHVLDRLAFWRTRCDLIFNRSIGYRGTERKSIVPALLEAAGIPYVGSTPYVLSLTRNKYHTKLVVRDAGIPTPPATLLFGGIRERLDDVIYPAIVKPVAESSSIGIEMGVSVVNTPAEARERAEILHQRYEQPVLVETFVPGVEVEAPVIVDGEPRALGVLALAVDGQLLDDNCYLASDLVYNDNYSFVAPPNRVDIEHVERLAAQAAQALGIRDYGRIDFRVDADGTPWFIEASTHPHIQRLSSFFVLAQQEGKAYHEMLDMLIQVAARRYLLERHAGS